MDEPNPSGRWRPSTPPLVTATADDLLRLHPVVVVHFWAEWNAHDREMDQRIQEIQPHFSGRVHFVSCNVDLPETAAFCKRCQLANLPTLAVFVAGRASRRPIVGLRSSSELIVELEKRLASAPAKGHWWNSLVRLKLFRQPGNK